MRILYCVSVLIFDVVRELFGIEAEIKMVKDRKTDIKKDFLWLALISVVGFIVWRIIGSITGINDFMTVDDLCSLQFAFEGEGVIDVIIKTIRIDPTNVPIFHALHHIWVSLVPFETTWWHVMPELFGMVTVFLCGMIGRKVNGIRTGMVCAILAATSYPLFYGSFQIRAYSLMMMFSAIIFLIWISDIKYGIKSVLYLIFMLLISFTHYFGVLYCAALGVVDLYLILRKKKQWKTLLPYVLYTMIFLPYLYVSFVNSMGVWGAFWPPVPEIKDIFIMIRDLCPLGNITIFIFIGVLFRELLIILSRNRISGKVSSKNFKTNYYVISSFWSIFFVISVVYIYSHYISPTRSVWVYRYFLVLIPNVILILATGMIGVFDFLNRKIKVPVVISAGAILLLFSGYNVYSHIAHWDKITYGGSDFEAVKETLLEEDDLNSPEGLLYMPYPDEYAKGWILFYTDLKQETMPNYICTSEKLMNTDLSAYQTIYISPIVYQMTENELNYINQTHVLEDDAVRGNPLVQKYVLKQ